MDYWVKPAVLENEVVRLEPIEARHSTDLANSARDGELWRLWYTFVPSPDTIDAFIEDAIQQQEACRAVVFAVCLKSTGEIVGSTRYLNIDHANHRLEIGYTWYAKSHQRTAVNTNCKHLLLSHAFEDLGAIAVEFRTHWMNHQSRLAIERLGAKQDGVLRNHTRTPDGLIRDTVVFSITDAEWPAVRKNLLFRLGRT